jgi:hypothetical protein
MFFFQIANRLDRVVADLGRKPLKVLVQVNTSGEECEYSCFFFNTIAWYKFLSVKCMWSLLFNICTQLIVSSYCEVFVSDQSVFCAFLLFLP